MAQFGWPDCPPPVRAQVGGFLAEVRELLGENLVGVYLHGSLAMGCFNPECSDIDLLVVTRTGMSVETKRAVIEMLLRCSGRPVPIEISFLREEDLHPWRYPTPFDLHYSETWRAQNERHLATGEWRGWNRTRYRDPDLAAHITITRHRGVCLHGEPIGDVFPEVPAEDYVAALLYDFEDARDEIAKNPVYGVLNLCRVYEYLLEGRISSKEEAGAWAVAAFPKVYGEVVEQALAAYRGRGDVGRFDEAALKRFARYVDERVQELLARG